MHYNRWLKYGDPHVSKIDRQSKHTICTVVGCDKPHKAKGYCQNHRVRFAKYGSPTGRSPKFRCKAKWVEANVAYQGDDCLKWPFGVSDHGRGTVSFRKRNISAPRAMCILAHGEPPTKKHDAAHSCGKGHEGCMNPRHLSWKTRKENEADKVGHGTLRRGTAINTNKLTEEDVINVRRLIKDGTPGVDIARLYGITPAMVSNIKVGKAWAWLDCETETAKEANRC